MGYGIGQVQIEGFGPLTFDKIQGFLCKEVMAVIIGIFLVVQDYFLLIFPEVGGIILMCIPLVQVTIGVIESLAVGTSH